MLGWFRKQGRQPARPVRPAVRPRLGRPALEALEDRCLPSTLTVINTNDQGSGSLRTLVAAANPGDTINFAIPTMDPGYNPNTGQFTITLTSGEIDVNQSVTIQGPGSGVLSVSGNNSSRIFGLSAAASISDLTLTNGLTSGSSGGAIVASAGLTLTDCVLSNNQAVAANGGVMELTGSGAYIFTDCTFSGNHADGNGGAVDSPGLNLTISGCTFVNNSSANVGGGNGGGAVSIGSGTVNLTNDAFTGNSTNNGQGGAINSNFGATFNVLSCTIAGNSALSGGGIAVGAGTFNLADTIVANNTAQSDNDIAGTVLSGDYNLIRDTTGTTITGTTTHNLIGVDPALGPLADNGGPTPTVALAVGSAALDQIPAASAPTLDQRGVARPVGANADVGAVEEDHNVFLVTNTNNSGSGSLAQAILDSNSTPLLAGNPNVIQFDIPGPGVQDIALTSALPQVTTSVLIDGYSQPGTAPNTLPVGDNAVIEIDLTNNSSSLGNGLDIAAANVTVRGLGISGFNTGGGNPGGNNILIEQTATNAVIQGNYIGLLPDDSSGGLNILGIFVNNAANVLIGGATPADRNVLIGNTSDAINITGSSAAGGVIAGNYIGVSPDVGSGGTNGNGGNGIELDSVNGVTVGGNSAAAGNVIGANSGSGILLNLSSSDLIGGNLIGYNPVNNVALGNSSNGITVDGNGDLIGADGINGFRNVISGNGGNGVELDNGSNTVAGDFIGADVAGNAAVGNGGDGVQVSGSSNNTIGGATAALRNVISGNGRNGVTITGSASGNMVEGNYIGTDASGAAALGNDTSGAPFGSGVSIAFAANNLVGGASAGAGNLISGNSGAGVYIFGSGSTGNEVQGNRIGANAAGNAGIPNTQNGVQIDNGASNNLIGVNAADANAAQEGNQISGNDGYGVEIGFNGLDASGNVVAGNLIGLNVAADGALGNQFDGVTIGASTNNTVGTTTGSTLERNVISGNGQNGVSIVDAGATGDVVAGNYIGTDRSGTVGVGNAQDGVFVGSGASGNTIGGTAAGFGNVISGNSGNGIELSGSGTAGNAAEGDIIGLDAAGAASLGNGQDGVGVDSGAADNAIGGTVANAGNLISGNGIDGIEISGGSGDTIQGNFSGIDAAGSAALANAQNGVAIDSGATTITVGGTVSGAGNVISGNLGDGIAIDGGSGNQVQGNLIGADLSGVAAIGNGMDGLLMGGGSTGNTVGGSAAAARNLISGNSVNGVELDGSGTTGNLVAGNFIGADVNGAPALGNGHDGVLLWQGASTNTIGGGAAAANLIAGNSANAVEINETQGLATGNVVQGLSRPTDALTVSDLHDAAGHTYDLGPGSVVLDGATVAAFDGLAAVTVQGGDAADAFDVTPSAAATFTVNGGRPNPPTPSGDTLNVDLTGATNPTFIKTFSRTTGYSGSWTFANRQDVNFTGIESLLPAEAQSAVLKSNGELDLYSTLGGGLQVLSLATTILSTSAVQAGGGATDVFAITSAAEGAQFQNTLWEFSTITGWSQLSTGSFAQISAATNAAGQGVVFGVLMDGSLWEQDPAAGTGLNQGFARLSAAGTIASVSAVTDQSGDPTVYAVVTAGDALWEYSTALGGNGWAQLSSGSFQTLSAGLNGSGQAMVYGMLTGGSLWEQDPASGTGLNAGWTELSGAGGAPAAFLSAAAGVSDTVFAIATDHTLWQHTASGFQQVSTGSFSQVSASETAPQDLAFGTLTGGYFWEYDAGLAPGNPWTQSISNGQPVAGAASSSTP